MSISLDSSIKEISSISAQYAKRLLKLEIKTLGDLIFYFPRRYEDFSRIVGIGQLKPDEPVSVHGIIASAKTRRAWGRSRFITEAIIEDDTGAIEVIWYNQPYLTQTLKKGARVGLAGKPALDKKGKLVFMSPEFELLNREPLHTSRLVPIYSETRGVSSKWLRWKISLFLPILLEEIQEEFPQDLLEKLGFSDIKTALRAIHFPETIEEAKKARARFSFTDLLCVRLRVLLEREQRKHETAASIPFDKEFIQGVTRSLGFSLTQDQRQAAWDIFKDVQKPYPMQRLLEGDVGTGKTLVALLAASLAAHQGKLVALMAPTEILASQHFETFTSLLSSLSFPIALFTRSMVKMYDPTVEHVRKLTPSEMREKIGSGEIKIVIGTHALISPISNTKYQILNTKYKNLALVIIDEQHRFGVEQRSHLLHSSGAHPHLLTMSATPIPRSLALTIYGNLQISLLKTFPKGARKIITRIVTPLKRAPAYEFIRQKMRQGHQVYVICPVIEESEKLDTKAAVEEYDRLKKLFPECLVGLLHGRMKSKEKENTMRQFLGGTIRLLVATSVVEVGVDVPGASIMVIEGAERFGLAQIHQLRGRIGRRGQAGHCFLFTNSRARATWARLKALTMSNDGFFLAQKDLEIRGPGQLLGTRQAGISDVAMEALGSSELVDMVRKEADELIAASADLSEWPLLKKKVEEMYGKVHLE
ncbi:MAG: ATP-dependent DNA helicase RecG [Candidatus Portnoybacteria bacterium]|nr:ATP-dependent DNA helicase RecG [Candidatus Portnoybacteria bacterium]